MNESRVEFLRRLISSPGPSGFEQPVQEETGSCGVRTSACEIRPQIAFAQGYSRHGGVNDPFCSST